jgi:hypothetical protein
MDQVVASAVCRAARNLRKDRSNIPWQAVARNLPASADTLATFHGGVTVVGEGEYWPSHQGQRLLGRAQINLTECLVVPDCLASTPC